MNLALMFGLYFYGEFSVYSAKTGWYKGLGGNELISE